MTQMQPANKAPLHPHDLQRLLQSDPRLTMLICSWVHQLVSAALPTAHTISPLSRESIAVCIGTYSLWLGTHTPMVTGNTRPTLVQTDTLTAELHPSTSSGHLTAGSRGPRNTCTQPSGTSMTDHPRQTIAHCTRGDNKNTTCHCV